MNTIRSKKYFMNVNFNRAKKILKEDHINKYMIRKSNIENFKIDDTIFTVTVRYFDKEKGPTISNFNIRELFNGKFNYIGDGWEIITTWGTNFDTIEDMLEKRLGKKITPVSMQIYHTPLPTRKLNRINEGSEGGRRSRKYRARHTRRIRKY